MKTPMQQLIEKIDYALSQFNKGEIPSDKGYFDCLTNIKNDIELQMIPIERVAIITAYENLGSFGCDGDVYYLETFKNK